ncbi:MAG: hypothetical protein KGJ07_05510 [Patescibacteria group bacterium]|nr:hypothetical protein [Patescibacteria group bacterium]MDE2589710.1 hypothetical protein [Patescibacteria group bacterium]
MVQTEHTVFGDPRTRAVSIARSCVESILRSSFGQAPLAKPFRGKLSTNPTQVASTITSETLKGKCGIISGELQTALATAGIPTDMCISEDRATTWHRSLRTVINGVEIILDASIGQYVEGYTHVFVGTRTELKQLILNPHTKIINTSISSKGDFFQRTWGNKGQVVKN